MRVRRLEEQVEALKGRLQDQEAAFLHRPPTEDAPPTISLQAPEEQRASTWCCCLAPFEACARVVMGGRSTTGGSTAKRGGKKKGPLSSKSRMDSTESSTADDAALRYKTFA